MKDIDYESSEEEYEDEIEDYSSEEEYEDEVEDESVPDMKKNLIIPLKDDYEFKLKLKNGSSMDVLIRRDGYVNATQLCKAGNKLFKHYNENKQTKSLDCRHTAGCRAFHTVSQIQ